jgi:hypothetical protein
MDMPSLYMVSAVESSMVEVMWPLLEPMILPALEHSNGELDVDTVRDNLIDKIFLAVTVSLGASIESVLVLEINEFVTGKKIMNIALGCGFLGPFRKDLLKVLDELAFEKGCEEIYIIGRPGWAKELKNDGFNTIHTVISRKVGETYGC